MTTNHQDDTPTLTEDEMRDAVALTEKIEAMRTTNPVRAAELNLLNHRRVIAARRHIAAQKGGSSR